MIALIAAASKNRAIGYKGAIPWHLPDDFKHFKEITSGHTVVMGRKTFESIGKALPNRRNIVITSRPGYEAAGCEVSSSLEQSLRGDDTFVIGGESIYRESLPLADKIYLTEVETVCEGDAFFPEIPAEEWELVSEEHHEADDRHAYAFTFKTYERRR